MSENVSVTSFDETAPRPRVRRAWRTIAAAGLAVGAADGLAAIVNSYLRGVSPARVFQFISSGLLGREAYNGAAATVLLGVALHFFIAFVWAAIFYKASRRFPALVRRPFIAGAIYGIAVYLVMYHAVMPLSATARLPFSIGQTLTNVLIHIFFVGLPIALVCRQFAKDD